LNKRTENIYKKLEVNINSDEYIVMMILKLETDEDDLDFKTTMNGDYEINDQNYSKQTSKISKGRYIHL
jgi:hypothetical protein